MELPVAQDICEHFKLKKDDKFLDIGCAKGFLVKDMLDIGIDSYGLDISDYALKNSEKETLVDYIKGQQFHYHFPIILLIVLYQLILYTTLIKMTLLSH